MAIITMLIITPAIFIFLLLNITKGYINSVIKQNNAVNKCNGNEKIVSDKYCPKCNPRNINIGHNIINPHHLSFFK